VARVHATFTQEGTGMRMNLCLTITILVNQEPAQIAGCRRGQGGAAGESCQEKLEFILERILLTNITGRLFIIGQLLQPIIQSDKVNIWKDGRFRR
jgi:hypothetical protein